MLLSHYQCCSGATFQLNNILLAGLFPLTGRDAELGFTVDSAAKLAAEDVNQDDDLLPLSKVRMTLSLIKLVIHTFGL